jgi:hypothetical protein
MIKTIKKVGALAVAVSLMTALFSQESLAFIRTTSGRIILQRYEENLAFIRALAFAMGGEDTLKSRGKDGSE